MIELAKLPQNEWYAILPSRSLKKAPVAVDFWGSKVVLFRFKPAGKKPVVVALEDRCPHRNVPLSVGKVTGAGLECAYHGWCFDSEGICDNVPALKDRSAARRRKVPRFFATEAGGYIWLKPPGATGADDRPKLFQPEGRFAKVRYATDFEADLVSVAENILDVPHTAYLHRGLFRTTPTKSMNVNLNPVSEGGRQIGFAANFIGEDRPSGLLGLLARGKDTVQHSDRFLLPSVAQVEYRYKKYGILINSFLTPAAPGRTLLFTDFYFRLPLGFLLAPFIKPVAMKVVKQDQKILKEQTKNVKEFGRESFQSTEADIFRPAVERLLQGKPLGSNFTKTIEILM